MPLCTCDRERQNSRQSAAPLFESSPPVGEFTIMRLPASLKRKTTAASCWDTLNRNGKQSRENVSDEGGAEWETVTDVTETSMYARSA